MHCYLLAPQQVADGNRQQAAPQRHFVDSGLEYHHHHHNHLHHQLQYAAESSPGGSPNEQCPYCGGGNGHTQCKCNEEAPHQFAATPHTTSGFFGECNETAADELRQQQVGGRRDKQQQQQQPPQLQPAQFADPANQSSQQKGNQNQSLSISPVSSSLAAANGVQLQRVAQQHQQRYETWTGRQQVASLAPQTYKSYLKSELNLKQTVSGASARLSQTVTTSSAAEPPSNCDRNNNGANNSNNNSGSNSNTRQLDNGELMFAPLVPIDSIAQPDQHQQQYTYVQDNLLHEYHHSQQDNYADQINECNSFPQQQLNSYEVIQVGQVESSPASSATSSSSPSITTLSPAATGSCLQNGARANCVPSPNFAQQQQHTAGYYAPQEYHLNNSYEQHFEQLQNRHHHHHHNLQRPFYATNETDAQQQQHHLATNQYHLLEASKNDSLSEVIEQQQQQDNLLLGRQQHAYQQHYQQPAQQQHCDGQRFGGYVRADTHLSCGEQLDAYGAAAQQQLSLEPNQANLLRASSKSANVVSVDGVGAAGNSICFGGSHAASEQTIAISRAIGASKQVNVGGAAAGGGHLLKSRRGRPRKKGAHSKNKISGKLWEFIRDLLLSESTNPSFIRWERREDGVFKFVQSDKVAKLWGDRKQNPKMTYEKLSRAMRYYYKSKVLLPVFGRRLVYKFGPNATGWLPAPPQAAQQAQPN